MQTILSLGNALNQGTARGMFKQIYIADGCNTNHSILFQRKVP